MEALPKHGFERARNSFSNNHTKFKMLTVRAHTNGFTETLPRIGPAMAGLTGLCPIAMKYEISAHFHGNVYHPV